MATITVGGSGNWDSVTVNAPWPGGTAPTTADDVVINNASHVLTIKGTACVAKSVTVTLGTLQLDQTAANKLTVENGIGSAFDSQAYVNFDTTGVAAFQSEILLNNSNGSSNLGKLQLFGKLNLKGAVKTRWTTTTASVSAAGTTATATAATGWRVGDRIIFISTQAYNATPKVDVMTLDATYTPGSTSLVFTAGFTYAHASGCIIGNFTSNLKIGPKTAGQEGYVRISTATNSSSAAITDVQFESCAVSGQEGALGIQSANSTLATISNNAFYDYRNIGLYIRQASTSYTRSNNIFYSTASGAQAISGQTGPGDAGAETGAVIFRSTDGAIITNPGSPLVSCYISGCTGFAVTNASSDTTMTGGGVFGNSSAFTSGASANGLTAVTGTAIGTSFSGAVNSVVANETDVTSPITFTDCPLDTTGVTLVSGLTTATPSAVAVSFVNKNTVVTAQEIYRGFWTTLRDNAIRKNSTSTVSIKPLKTATACTYVTSVPCANGASITLTGNLKYDALFYNGGTWTAPTVTITGLGISTQTFTAASGTAPTVTMTIASPCVLTKVAHGFSVGTKVSLATTGALPTGLTAGTEYYVSAVPSADTFRLSATYGGSDINTSGSQSGTHSVLSWQAVSLSATNSSGADGNFTVTFTANAASAVTGTVYFDGMPTASPFVTKARHYGKTFDQTTTNSVANSSVSANEATANAYTGIAVTGGSSVSPIVLGASHTFQEVYDYTQAWSCRTDSLSYAIPCTAPVAGSLVAGANVTTTGYSLTGTGSIAMGSYTLTSEFTVGGYAYTYTGGTYSQASAGSPAFSGGTITMPTLGAVTATMTFTASSCTLDMKPSSSSANYNCGSGTFSGTITITNTTGVTCTLQLPTGTTVSNSTSGANLVTVVTPSVYQSVTVTGFTAGSRIWIKDVTSGNVLFNGTASAGDTIVSGSTATWTDSTPASATRQIAVRVAYVSTVTAKTFVDVADIGTCATSGSGKDITYIVAQTADTTYNSNGIDGSTVSDVTFTDAATDLVVCNLAGGSTTYPRLYAAFVYWMFSSSGIDDDNTYIDAPDTANYLFTAMKIRNTNATPLTITGGYGRDATSGLVADIVDVAGSTGNIYPQPDHVVAYQTTGTYAITGDISTVLTSIGTVPAAVITAAQADPIYADIRKVKGITVDGTGTDADPWGP